MSRTQHNLLPLLRSPVVVEIWITGEAKGPDRPTTGTRAQNRAFNHPGAFCQDCRDVFMDDSAGSIRDSGRMTAHSEVIASTPAEQTRHVVVERPIRKCAIPAPQKFASGKLATIFKLPHYRRRREFRRKSNRRCLNSMMSSFAAAAAGTMIRKGRASSAFSITLQWLLQDPGPEALGSA